MARPVAADAEATRARILQAALALVADHGIEGTSIRDVAAGARVSLATVLHYYGSKDGLYEACIDAMYVELEALRGALLGAFRPGASVEELVTDTVRTAVRFVRQHRAAHRILLRTVVDEGGMKPERREKYLRPFLDDISTLLAPLLGLDPVHTRLTAQSVTHLTVRYMLHSPEELRILTGETTEAKAQAAVEQHIIDVARAMLLGAKVPSQPPASASGAKKTAKKAGGDA